MAKFILGYKPEVEVTNDGANLTVYQSAKEADYDSEEWVVVEAETLEQARLLYESAFTEWQRKGESKQ